MRRVLIGTPCYDGRTDVWYNDSLNNTIRIAKQHHIQLDVVYMSYDSLVQRARNDIVKLAVAHEFDDLIFIDSDQGWESEWVFRLLKHPVDVVGGAVPKKTDAQELYNVRINDLSACHLPLSTLISVDGIGTGFLRLSKKALLSLWWEAEPYRNEGKESRMVFDVRVVNGELVSEDNVACNKLKELGFQIWLDRTMTCSHIGIKKWTGDFNAYFEKQLNSNR